MDENGLQFFNLIDQNAIGCWNFVLPYAPINQAIVARHDEALIFPADIKVRSVIGDNYKICYEVPIIFIYSLPSVGEARLTLDHIGSDADLLVVVLELLGCEL